MSAHGPVAGSGRRARCAIGALAVGVGALVPQCGPDREIAQFKNAEVLYEGEPYGDLLVLGEQVRDCMHGDQRSLPRVILVDQLFDCYTVDGWQQAIGCAGDDLIVLTAPALVESEGALWSHELTHYFGAGTEAHVCGALRLEGFSLELPDAGR